MNADDVQRRRHEADELAAAAVRMLRALARRAGEGDEVALEALHGIEGELPELVAAGAAGFKASGRSWAEVGRAVGTTRQNAQQRFGDASTAAAHGPRCRCLVCAREDAR